MPKSYVIPLVSLVAGIGVAAAFLGGPRPEPAAGNASAGSAARFDPGAGTDARLRALEEALAQERDARQLLEEELQILFAEIEVLRDATEGTADAAAVISAPTPESIVAPLADGRRGGYSDDARTARLVQAGFSPTRADWIVQREAELALEAMQARFEAQRAGDMQAMFDASRGGSSALRDELGDAEYEQYLEAYGRSTAVTVRRVLESSPGQRAGLQPGDEIVSYDGRRVFSFGELSDQLLQGEPGESVVVDIRRDGMPVQLVMPRGPIGIEGGRGRR